MLLTSGPMTSAVPTVSPTDVSLFAHGINSSPAGDKLYVMVNGIAVDAVVTDGSVSTYPSFKSPTGFGLNVTAHPVGTFIGYLLKMSDVVSGTVSTTSILASHVDHRHGSIHRTMRRPWGSVHPLPRTAPRSSSPAKTVSLCLMPRTCTPISTSTGTTLGDQSIGDPASNAAIENHDAMATPDSKYAILTIRYADSTTGGFQTGGLQLYDLTDHEAGRTCYTDMHRLSCRSVT